MSEDENPLRRKLERELEASQWLQKFKQLNIGLQRIQAEIPLTQLCELKWATEDDSLAIHCPNPEIRAGLVEQRRKLAQFKMGATCFILKYPGLPDLAIAAEE